MSPRITTSFHQTRHQLFPQYAFLVGDLDREKVLGLVQDSERGHQFLETGVGKKDSIRVQVDGIGVLVVTDTVRQDDGVAVVLVS